MIPTARRATSGEGRGLLDPGLVSEFYLWFWWWTETSGRKVDLGGALGSVDAWVENRVSLSERGDEKNTTVLSGDRAPGVPEAHAAIEGGKMPEEIRIAIVHEERAFGLTVKGPHLDVSGLRLPGEGGASDEEQVLARLVLVEEATDVLAGLFHRYAEMRVSPLWEADTLPAMRAWVQSRPSGRRA